MEFEFDIRVVSKEIIKPSSPTPPLLRHYQLSFLDQIQPPIFMPFVMFYPTSQNNVPNEDDLFEKLKNSLSQTLTIFYPLAGRIKDNNFVDCNDEGVFFLKAKANCHLSDILDRRDPGNNNKLISVEFDASEIPAVVQLTFFECGGLVLFFRMSHKLGDALSFLMFINCWAAIARGDDPKVITPRFESAAIFPPKNISFGFPYPITWIDKNIITKKFVFDASSVATLRDKYTKDGVRPSRVEALSAFIWSRFMASTQAKSDPEKLYNVINTVNLRPRMEPPLSNYHFGNISQRAITEPKPFPDGEDGFNDIVNRVRDAIKKVNAESVKKLQELGVGGTPNDMNGDVESFAFTSLCRFPFYEADFGWGKPEWVGSVSLTKENVVVFFDTKSGDGIEAWINLKEEEMAQFENDKEILSFI